MYLSKKRKVAVTGNFLWSLQLWCNKNIVSVQNNVHRKKINLVGGTWVKFSFWWSRPVTSLLLRVQQRYAVPTKVEEAKRKRAQWRLCMRSAATNLRSAIVHFHGRLYLSPEASRYCRTMRWLTEVRCCSR